LGESFLEKMEIGESFFGKNHGKLSHLRNLAPKIIYGSTRNDFVCSPLGILALYHDVLRGKRVKVFGNFIFQIA
jgi:hypothetical protein